MAKRLCGCGCGERVTINTERAHLQMGAMYDLGSQVLQKLSSSSTPKRKRKAATVSSLKTGRAAKRANQPSLQADFHTAEVGDYEFEVGGHDAANAPSHEALPDNDGIPDGDSSSELSRLRRSARIRAHMEFISQSYRPDYELSSRDIDKVEEDVDDNDDDDAGDGDDDSEDEGAEDEDEGNSDEEHKRTESDDTSWSKEDFWMDADGLSVEDRLDEDFLREFADLKQKTLDEGDMRLLKAYILKTEDGLSDRTFEKLRFLIPEADITSFKQTESRVQRLSGVRPIRYDCCPQSCICYVGTHYEQLTECPYCKTPRYKLGSDKVPSAYFEYLPISSRLRAMVANKDTAQTMTYRKQYSPNPDRIADVFDGSHYRKLLTEPVKVANQIMPYCHFSDDRDIALGLSTDGFQPFKRRSKTAWPLVLFNYNLPPEERFSKNNLLSAGVIPGPNKPKDMDSFLWPLVHELIELAIGLAAFDALSKAVFMLHAYLLLVFGDIPAVSLVMRMKGQNACKPCRMCEIEGIRQPNTKPNSPLYVPLHRAHFPDSPPSYDPRNLPHRTHATLLHQAMKVQQAKTKTKSEELAVEYGIKGVPLLSYLSSISFPDSFPYDFMHLMWCNLLPNLFKLWTGKFKKLNHHDECYKLDDKVWKAIGKDTAAAGAHIPSAFGSRVPNIEKDPSHLISETYSNWTLHLSPAILRNRFLDQRVYKHHLLLVNLLRSCLEYDFNSEKLQELEEGFVNWIEGYERIYYKHDPLRVSSCPLTVHALLHVTSSIRALGPVWAYWAFPMERHCGDIAQHVGSRRYPYISINRYLRSKTHISQIKLLYNLHDELSLKPPPDQKDCFTSGRYKLYVLSPPIQPRHTLSNGLWLKLTASLATRFEVTATTIRKLIPALTPFDAYGRIQRLEGGDKMHARDLVKLTSDSRDMSYVHYRLLVDKFAHVQKKEPEFVWREHYGQLQRVIVVDVPTPSPPNAKIKAGIYIYAIIRNYDVVSESIGLTAISYFVTGDEGRTEVVDLNRVKCVIGRIRRGNRWAIVDRHRSLFPAHSR